MITQIYRNAVPILCATAVVAATAMLAASAAHAGGFKAGLIQTLSVTSTRGNSSMQQTYAPGTVSNSHTRVCLVNTSPRKRSFVHAVPNINSLTAGTGGISCANFSSSSRVGFGMMDGGEPAQANRQMVMSLSAFAGGTVTFVWN